MRPDVDGDNLERAMASALRENTVKVEGIIGQVERKLEQHYERTARLLASYREDNHRAILSIYKRLVSLEDTFNTDRGTRVERQSTLDGRLDKIQANQRLWIRIAIVVFLVGAGLALGWLL